MPRSKSCTRCRWSGIEALTAPLLRSNTTGSLLIAVGPRSTASRPRTNHAGTSESAAGAPFTVMICAGFLVRRRMAVRIPCCLSGIVAGA